MIFVCALVGQIKDLILSTRTVQPLRLRVYVFRIIIISTTDSICKLQPVVICNGEAGCFLCGRNLIFMYYLDRTYASMCRQLTISRLVKKLSAVYKTTRFIFLMLTILSRAVLRQWLVRTFTVADGT